MATTAKSVILRDKDDGKQLLPMTRAELVILNNGTSVETGLANKEDTTNKVTSLSSSSTDTEYPSAKAVFDALGSAGGGTEHNLRVSPNSVFDMSLRHIDLLPHSSRIFSWSQLKNVTAIHRGIYNIRKSYGTNINLNGADPTFFGIYKSNNTYLRVFPYGGIQIKCELVLNGTTSQSEVIISNQTTVFNTYNDYAIDFDKDLSLIRLYTYDPTNSAVTKVGQLDVSTWNLSSFDEVYFATTTQNASFYKACVTVMVNSPRTFGDYLGAPMYIGRYNDPVGTEYSDDLYLAGTGLTLNGTITQTISDTDKVTSFSNSSIGYFEVGPSNLGNAWQYMWYHVKMRFSSVGTGMYIQPGVMYWDKIIVESATLPVITFSNDLEQWTPEVDTDYDVYVKFAEKPNTNSTFYNQTYEVKTALRIYGDATVEVSEPYCFNAQVQNLCAETYNGSGFEGAIPFDGKSGFVPVTFEMNYEYAHTRIPIGAIYIHQTLGYIYMWNGSVWKLISNV